MKLTTRILDLRAARGGFRIAREHHTTFRHLVVEIEHDGAVGRGEAAPSAFFDNETLDDVLQSVETARGLLGDDPFRIEDITARLCRALPKAHAAICAIDVALHDLAAQLMGVPLWRWFGLDPAAAPATSYTISLDEPEAMARHAAEVAGRFRVLKIKVGTDQDDARLQAIRRVTDLPLRLDANTGWTAEQAVETINRIAGLGIEFVEQPIPVARPDELRWIRQRVDVPIIVDEDAVRAADLPALVGCVDGINIKLTKCGGLREAVRMIHFAQACGMRVMLGCMLETSLGITAAAHLSPMVDWADLDGHLLIEDDPYRGTTIQDGRLVLPDGPGLGVIERQA